MEPQQIVVVTHNGKLPRDGGIRFGYVVGNVAVGAVRIAKPTPPPPPPKPKIVFSDLPFADSFDDCPVCFSSTIPAEVQTDLGKKWLRKCKKCGQICRRRDFSW